MLVYDFGLGWPDEGKEYVFVNALRDECKFRNMRFILVNGYSVDSVTEEVRRNRLKIHFFLDLASETVNPDDRFTRLVYSLKDSGSRVVADPDRARFAADKSITHYSLVNANIPVPFTVVIRKWEPSRALTDYEREHLGLPFIIKPALGYGQRGIRVIRKRMGLKEMSEARAFDPGDNFLLQEYVLPANLAGSPAWFRVFYILGDIILCWWNNETSVYRPVTLREYSQFKLSPLVFLCSEIASITGIEWFSCEIALRKKDKRFVVIDYMNDQFDVSSQSQWAIGVPDKLLILFAQRMVEKIWQYQQGRIRDFYRAVWFIS
jgi:hypothetical protein